MLRIEYLKNPGADACYKVYINYPEADTCYNVYIFLSDPEADACYKLNILKPLELTLVTKYKSTTLKLTLVTS